MKKRNFLMALILMVSFPFSQVYAETIMFLTSSSTATKQADLTVIEALEEGGYDVTVRLASSFDPSTELDGVDCIYISEAISSGDPTKLYTAECAGEIGIGIINCEPYAYTAARLPWLIASSVGLSEFSASSASVYATEAGLEHEIMINAGVDATGEVLVVDPSYSGANTKLARVSTSEINYGTVLATNNDASSTFLAALDKGTVCDNEYVTTGRRVHFFMGDSNNELTEDGKALLIAAVEWCIDGNEDDVVVEPDIDDNDDPVVDDAKEGTVLFLTTTDTPTADADTTVINTLEGEGYDVTVKKLTNYTSTDLEGVDCIYISEAVTAATTSALYTAEQAGEVDIAIINCKSYAYTSTYGYMPWIVSETVGVDQFTASSATLYVTEEGLAHEIMINAGIESAGALVVVDPATDGSNTKLSRVLTSEINQGTILATSSGDVKTYLAAIEKGTACDNNYVTTGRRVHFFMGNGVNALTQAGKAILLSTVEWCIAGNDLDSGTVGVTETTTAQCKYVNNTLVVEQVANIEVYTISGELCASQSNVTSFDCSSLNKGVYIARVVFSNGGSTVCKIMVK